MLNFPKIPKIALRKFSELSTSLCRSKGDFRVKLTFFWVALHMIGHSKACTAGPLFPAQIIIGNSIVNVNFQFQIFRL